MERERKRERLIHRIITRVENGGFAKLSLIASVAPFWKKGCYLVVVDNYDKA